MKKTIMIIGAGFGQIPAILNSKKMSDNGWFMCYTEAE